MEIFHVFGVHWKLLLAQAVNFSIALYVLYRFVYKPIFAILAEREAKIDKGLKDAEEAGRERDRVKGESEAIIRESRAEGGKLVDALHKEGLEKERKIVREAEERAQALLTEARVRGEEERAHLLRESEKEVAKMAILSAEKLLRAKLGSS